ncbi:MAG: hypothetical protein WC008_04125 [Bacilli bacterium]
MFEYRVIEAKNAIDAETKMNLMAKDGWKVVSTSYWTNFKVLIIITFEREKEY